MTFYNATPFQGTGTPITGTLDGNDQYFHAAGITVFSTNTYGLSAAGGGNSITIEGTLIGFDGMQVGAVDADFGNRVVIGATGVVIGTNDDTIEANGGQTTISNAGVISGKYGVYFSSQLGTGSTLINSGRILAEFTTVSANGSEKVSLQNSGTITSYSSQSFTGNAGADMVTNRGTMNGNILFNANADRYDGTGGRVNGIVFGGDGNDILIGGTFVDKLHGGANNDLLWGRAGKDTLAGDLGQDKFYFDTAPNTILNRDTITDFTAADDTIYLKKSVMAGLTQGVGFLQAQFYWESATGVAHDADDRIIYNTSNGVLSYDSNGNAAGGVQQIAVLSNFAGIGLSLSNADFFVY